MTLTVTNNGAVTNTSVVPPNSYTATVEGTKAGPTAPVTGLSVFWGQIEGDITQQGDLQGELALKADEIDLQDHVTDFNNPHHVDKADVGLPNVENLSPAELAVVISPDIQINAAQILDSSASGRNIIINATPAGAAVSVAATPAIQRTALGASVIGDAVFTAANQNAAALALGIARQPSFRNLIDNSHYFVGQLTPPVLTTTGYMVDRWKFQPTGTVRVNAQRSQAAPQPGTPNQLLVTVTATGAPTAGDISFVLQALEGTRLTDTLFGTAGARNLVVTIEVRSSVPGTYPFSMRNAATDRSYVTPFVINNANTWETKTFVIPGETTGTWNTSTNLAACDFGIAVTCGTTYQTPTPGAWANGNYIGLAGQTQFNAAPNASTFYLGRVQVELDVQTPFELLPFEKEWHRAQFFMYAPISSATNVIGPCWTPSANLWYCILQFATRLRTTPILVTTGTFNLISPTAIQAVTGIAQLISAPHMVMLSINVSGSAQPAGTPGYFQGNASNPQLYFDAQL